MKRSLFSRVLLSFVAVLAMGASAVAKDAPLRVLIFSGLNNHDWRSTTPELEAMFKACPRFGTVDITDNPGQCDAATFARYDVIVSNWTPYPKTAREWPEATEKAFFDFMNKGGGFVVFHAAACTFQEWPEFQRVIGLTWEEKKTSHARYGVFKVSVKDAKHPIARGLGDFYIMDELYQNMVAKTEKPFSVIFDAFSAKATGGTDKVEPMLITLPCGKGRGVNLMLGHDVPAMRNAGFRTLMLRSAEWAATGHVTVPAAVDWPVNYASACVAGTDVDTAVKAASAYRKNEDRAPLAIIENLIAAASGRKEDGKLAACLAKALQGDATPDAKTFFCRELGVIGNEAHVPAIAALLGDKAIETAARRALEQIPGKAADKALLNALEHLPPNLQVGVINSLGERRTVESVAALSEKVGDNDAGEAAVHTLGKIGTKECARVLRDTLAKASKAQKNTVADACITCAERLGGAEAVALCKAVEGAEVADAVQAAAWLTRAQGSGTACLNEAARMIQSDNSFKCEAALRYLRVAKGSAPTHVLLDALKGAEPGRLILLLAALSDRGDDKASRAVLPLARHGDPSVRLAALKALARVGDAAAVPALLDHAAYAKGAERDAAQVSLVRLNAKDVDAALVKAARASAPEVRVGVLRVLAARKATSQMNVVLAATADNEDTVRQAAWSSLKELAKPAQLSESLGRLPDVRDAERTDAEEAILSIARQMPETAQQAALMAGWDGADNARTRSLMRVMGLLGNDWTLATVRDIYARAATPGLRETAVRILAAWPTAAPLDDLFAIAHSDSEEGNRLLAVQGLAPMIARIKTASPEDVIARLADALKLAVNDQDKRALLGEVGQRPCVAALELALEYLAQPGIANEAGVAAIQAASTLDVEQRPRVKAAMRAVIAAAPSRDVDKQADALLWKAVRPANLALGATATSPDNLDCDGAASGDHAAIDGNPDTYWDELDNQPLYVFDVTFKEPTQIAGLCIKGHAYHSHSPKDFDILCDGNVVKTVRNAEYDQSTNEFIAGLPATTCKTLELRITGYYAASPGIRELEIYATNPEEATIESTMPNPPKYHWLKNAANDTFALMNDEHIVWQFNYAKDLPKPFFAPVTLGGGMELTWLSPPDHWWHRGLWFSWKELNGVNYWEEDKERHCQGCNEVTAAKAIPNDDNSARIEMTISYHPPNEPPVLTEKRSMSISAPDPCGGYSIDWRSDFTAGPQDVHMKGGTAGGGYAGLSARIAPKSRNWQLVDSEGRADVPTESLAKNTHGQRARWMDFTLVDMCSGETAGMAIFDHPANLRFPSQWHNLLDDKIPFGYFSPAPLWSEPYTLPAGETMTLRYRILIHPGRTDRAHTEEQWCAWTVSHRR